MRLTTLQRIPRLGNPAFAENPKIETDVTYHRGINAPIEPGPFGIPHGMTGWRGATLVIYNKKWAKPGWYTLKEYRRLKYQAYYEEMEAWWRSRGYSPPVQTPSALSYW